ncbi:MAG: hypothetical protein IPJ69_02270 [Deltaproteobacteria bacterium]|nr:MAG: hypothetical protein IPJ69_02270 [Deltaproteobacteria bacterium]
MSVLLIVIMGGCGDPSSSPPSTTTISTSTSSLLVKASGSAKTITITNGSDQAALDVSYTITPALPSGTTISPATCGNVTTSTPCILTMTPGSIASGDIGSSPTPSTITIQGSNTNAATIAVTLLTYGNLYQKGLIFSIDDRPTHQSVVGKTASLINNSGGAEWIDTLTGVAAANRRYQQPMAKTIRALSLRHKGWETMRHQFAISMKSILPEITHVRQATRVTTTGTYQPFTN